MKCKLTLCRGVIMTLLLSVVVSCEKVNLDEYDDGDAKDANVTLFVSSIEQIPFPQTRAGDITTLCTRLNYAVYDSTGVRIWKTDQKSGDENFGQVKLSLAKGHYFLMAVAHNCTNNPTTTNAAKIQFTNKTGYTDTSYYGDSLIVGDTPINRSLPLHRNVAKVRFEFTDEPPANATRIRFEYKGGSGAFDAATGWGVVASDQYQWYDIVGGEECYEIYTIPHNDDRTLKVMVDTYHITDDEQMALTSKVIEGIPVTRNRITICRGNLFDNESSAPLTSEFSVTIEDEWQEGETVIF